MTTLVKVSIGLAAVSGIIALVLAIKGPFNRARNEINDKLDAEYVVDNYKAEYVKLHNAKGEVSKKLSDIKTNKAVAEKKLAYALKTYAKAKQEVIETGTSDMKKFNIARDFCESKKLEVENLMTMIDVYSNAVVKLEASLNLVDCNMRKTKYNVDTLAAKKTLDEMLLGDRYSIFGNLVVVHKIPEFNSLISNSIDELKIKMDLINI